MIQKLIKFLERELLISPASLKLGLEQSNGNFSNLPIVLWQYGLINLKELDAIFTWIESQDNLSW